MLKMNKCMGGHIFNDFFDQFEHIDAQIEPPDQSQP